MHACRSTLEDPTVAFDDSIPVYLPIYMHSRWRDLQQIRAAATAQGGAMLDRQVVFSTGWEWGYWQNDAAALRMTFALPDHWSQPIEDMYAPWGDAGRALSSAIAQLGDAQFDALVTHQLAAYLAGRDALIDYGQSSLGIVSQPSRPQFADVVAMDATSRAAFATNVLAPLDALAAATDAARDAVNAIAVDPADPWFAEMRDAFTVDSARTRFAAAVWHAAERMGAVGNDAGYLALAQQALADGQAAVMHRHAHLHWPEPASLLLRSYNPTVYPMGYLYFADSLCYWQRELEQIRAIVQGRMLNAPTCFLVL